MIAIVILVTILALTTASIFQIAFASFADINSTKTGELMDKIDNQSITSFADLGKLGSLFIELGEEIQK
jgi:hypothetical protein